LYHSLHEATKKNYAVLVRMGLASQFDFNSTLSYMRFHCCQWQWLFYENSCLCFSCPLRIQLNSRLWGDSWCPVLLPSCHVWSVSHWDSCLHFFLYADLPVTKVKNFSLSFSLCSELKPIVNHTVLYRQLTSVSWIST